VAFSLQFTATARRHLTDLTAAQRRRIVSEIEKNLIHDPFTETMHRKKLRPNPVAGWELRVGDHRVFYDQSDSSAGQVDILSIGLKRGSRLFIDHRETEL